LLLNGRRECIYREREREKEWIEKISGFVKARVVLGCEWWAKWSRLFLEFCDFGGIGNGRVQKR
jgi:hypothetical protein